MNKVEIVRQLPKTFNVHVDGEITLKQLRTAFGSNLHPLTPQIAETLIGQKSFFCLQGEYYREVVLDPENHQTKESRSNLISRMKILKKKGDEFTVKSAIHGMILPSWTYELYDYYGTLCSGTGADQIYIFLTC